MELTEEEAMAGIKRFASHLPEPWKSTMEEHMDDDCDWDITAEGGGSMFCTTHDVKVAPGPVEADEATRQAVVKGVMADPTFITALMFRAEQRAKERE